jgi:hypothetical protein
MIIFPIFYPKHIPRIYLGSVQMPRQFDFVDFFIAWRFALGYEYRCALDKRVAEKMFRMIFETGGSAIAIKKSQARI